jgi:hypothetical protein
MEDTTAQALDGSALSADGLAALRREFPAFQIWEEAAGVRIRYVARGLRLGTRPYTVVTGDPTELRAALAAGTAGPEYPQAIADDYPGWDIICDDGQWTASCPALTVRAPTSAGLRAAIERAIGDPAPGAW